MLARIRASTLLARMPTPNMKANFYYRIMGETRGPVSGDELRRLAREGKDIQPDTFVRRGAEEWMTADRIVGLFPPGGPQPQFFFQVMGEIHGPITEPGLRRLVAQNDITRDTFVRRDDQDWVTADQVEGLLP